MRRLRPNQQGALVPVKPKTLGLSHQYKTHIEPSRALVNLDQVLSGNPPKILIVRSLGGIGDVLMTTPTVRAIAKKYSCKVDYATDFGYLDEALVKVLQGNPYINDIIPWREADHDAYNAILDITCPCTHHEKPLAPPINRIDLFARYCGLSIPIIDSKMDYFLTEDEKSWAAQYLEKYGLDRYKLIMVQPSSSTTKRDCPPDKLRAAIGGILQADRQIRALVITHNTDNQKTDWPFADVHVLKDLDIRQLAAIMHFCQLVICPDSSILHMASVQSKPTVTIFGPTDPRARVNYHPEAVAIWPSKNLKNYPSWYHDPQDGYLCWKLLQSSLITNVALSILNKINLPNSDELVTFGNYQRSDQPYEIL